MCTKGGPAASGRRACRGKNPAGPAWAAVAVRVCSGPHGRPDWLCCCHRSCSVSRQRGGWCIVRAPPRRLQFQPPCHRTPSFTARHFGRAGMYKRGQPAAALSCSWEVARRAGRKQFGAKGLKRAGSTGPVAVMRETEHARGMREAGMNHHARKLKRGRHRRRLLLLKKQWQPDRRCVSRSRCLSAGCRRQVASLSGAQRRSALRHAACAQQSRARRRLR